MKRETLNLIFLDVSVFALESFLLYSLIASAEQINVTV